MKKLLYIAFALTSFWGCSNSEKNKTSSSETTRPDSVDVVSTSDTSNFNRLANLPLSENRPTSETTKALNDELLFQRATQTYLWALPLINTLGMKEGSEKVFGAGYNVLPIWKKRLDAKT